MGRKTVERRVPPESMLDLIPRIGRSVQEGRKELHTLLPHSAQASRRRRRTTSRPARRP